MVQNCPFCKSKVEADFKFCGVCGKLLEKKCQKCNIKFEPTFNFCGQCGSSLQKSSIDTDFKPKSQKRTDLNQNSGIRVKVGILFGFDLSCIKQEQGGGPRRITLNNTDDYRTILKKITELYFPKNSYTCLGHAREYRINILDFKKQILNGFSFRDLSTYVNTHGLTLQVKPIFFLHLFKNENIPNSSSVFSDSSRSRTTNDPQIDHVAKKIKKEPEDVDIIPLSISKSALATSNGNDKKLAESSSSSETESEDDKIKPSWQNTEHESLRQKNKLVNPSTNLLANKRIFKRTSSSSSSCSISSSSSTASFKKAQRLDKKLNRRLKNLKNEASSNNVKKNHNDKPLLPTPNVTPSIKANLVDQIKKCDHNPSINKNDVILLKDKLKEKCDKKTVENEILDKNDKFNNDNNFNNSTNWKNHNYNRSYRSYSSNYSNYHYSRNNYKSNGYYQSNYRYNNYKDNQYSIKRYNDRKNENYHYNSQREYYK